MPAGDTEEAAKIAPPRQGAIYQFTIGAADAIYTIPDDCKSKWITIQASDTIFYHLSDVDTKAVAANVASTESDGDGSSGDPFVLAAAATTGRRMPAGEHSIRLDARDKFLTVIGENAGTEVCFWPSGG